MKRQASIRQFFNTPTTTGATAASSSSSTSCHAKKNKAEEDSPVSLSSSPPAAIGVVWRFYSLYCWRQETLDKSAARRMNPWYD
ncbi:hypothetical protein HDU78_010538 [Chytriomyces hyalinus]|nr:hypothetical protein HDU78_010538 [Chytriomyces hyalinus]